MCFSHAVRISGKATKDRLKAEFLSSFRCKYWTLNVILLLNSLDYLTYRWWSIKTMKTWGLFAIESQSEDDSTRDRSINTTTHTQMDICIYFLHISFLVTSYIDSWIIVLSTAALRFSANNIFSIRKLECNFFWLRVIVYIFAYGLKIVLYYFTVNWRDIVYLIVICQTFCALCQRMSSMYHKLRL